MSFHNVILPNFISKQLYGMFYYHTNITRTMSEREHRVANLTKQKKRFYLKNFYLSASQFHELTIFYQARYGRLYSFLMKDPADYQLDKIYAGTCDGVKTKYTICQYFEGQEVKFEKPIYFIDKSSLKLYNVEGQKESTKYDFKDFQLVFAAPPSKGKKLIISCNFFKQVRFDHDQLEYKIADNGAYFIENLSLIEL